MFVAAAVLFVCVCLFVCKYITSAVRKGASMSVSLFMCVCGVDELSHLVECVLINPGRVLIQEMGTD